MLMTLDMPFIEPLRRIDEVDEGVVLVTRSHLYVNVFKDDGEPLNLNLLRNCAPW